mmetsp:Transcript_21967/g.70104  ORF Transcript_21967/g.70104 Transcript_21967/m.70104 type:complete len:256 (+) Transcript_21967:182-949(+)
MNFSSYMNEILTHTSSLALECDGPSPVLWCPILAKHALYARACAWERHADEPSTQSACRRPGSQITIDQLPPNFQVLRCVVFTGPPAKRNGLARPPRLRPLARRWEGREKDPHPPRAVPRYRARAHCRVTLAPAHRGAGKRWPGRAHARPSRALRNRATGTGAARRRQGPSSSSAAAACACAARRGRRMRADARTDGRTDVRMYVLRPNARANGRSCAHAVRRLSPPATGSACVARCLATRRDTTATATTRTTTR